MIIPVYHCSTVEIESFYIPYGGLHLGGINSALEAALRKIRASDDGQYIYLHRVLLNIDNPYDVEDCGSNELWDGIIQYLTTKTDHDSIRYVNKFEPDMVPSYAVFDVSRVQIKSCTKLHQDEAEDILNGFLDMSTGGYDVRYNQQY